MTKDCNGQLGMHASVTCGGVNIKELEAFDFLDMKKRVYYLMERNGAKKASLHLIFLLFTSDLSNRKSITTLMDGLGPQSLF